MEFDLQLQPISPEAYLFTIQPQPKQALCRFVAFSSAWSGLEQTKRQSTFCRLSLLKVVSCGARGGSRGLQATALKPFSREAIRSNGLFGGAPPGNNSHGVQKSCAEHTLSLCRRQFDMNFACNSYPLADIIIAAKEEKEQLLPLLSLSLIDFIKMFICYIFGKIHARKKFIIW